MSAIRDYIEKNESNIDIIGSEYIAENSKKINSLVKQDLYTYMLTSQCDCITYDNGVSNKKYFLQDENNVKNKCFFDKKFDRNNVSEKNKNNFKEST